MAVREWDKNDQGFERGKVKSLVLWQYLKLVVGCLNHPLVIEVNGNSNKDESKNGNCTKSNSNILGYQFPPIILESLWSCTCIYYTPFLILSVHAVRLSGYPSEQRRKQTNFQWATFPRSSLDRVVLFQKLRSILETWTRTHKARCITIPMLYH